MNPPLSRARLLVRGHTVAAAPLTRLGPKLIEHRRSLDPPPEPEPSSLLVLLRHGESRSNRQRRYTGRQDVPLTREGERQALEAGARLGGHCFDAAFTSRLSRAQRTLALVLEALGQRTTLDPVVDGALDERSFGALEGRLKSEARATYGEAQLGLWENSWDAAPPLGETLLATQARVVSFFRARVLPELRAARSILIVAHGNALRTLVAELERLDPTRALEVRLANAEPILYRFDCVRDAISRIGGPRLDERNAREGLVGR